MILSVSTDRVKVELHLNILENKNLVVTIRLQGGLGNQMFQFAAAKSLSIAHKCRLLLDISLLQQTAFSKEGFTSRKYELGIFKKIHTAIASEKIIESYLIESKRNKLFKKTGLPYKKQYVEPAFTYNTDLFLQQPPVLLSGYFQSEKYFSRVSETILDSFSFSQLKANDSNAQLLQNIRNRTTTSVHIRRSDYVKDPATNAVHGTCSIDYYSEAFAYMKQQIPGVAFVFFSDDPAWVKEAFLQHLPDSVLVENNDGADSWKDMYLMSKCNHHIIANSSFSWWGAWLNTDPKKMVIAPKIWFADAVRNEATKDLIPENWISL